MLEERDRKHVGIRETEFVFVTFVFSPRELFQVLFSEKVERTLARVQAWKRRWCRCRCRCRCRLCFCHVCDVCRRVRGFPSIGFISFEYKSSIFADIHPTDNETMPAPPPPSHQDWTPVVVHKRPVTQAELRDEKAVNAARRQGVAVDTSARFDACKNKAKGCGGQGGTVSSAAAAKIDAETEDFRHRKLPSELRLAIVRARTAKGMTQAQLAAAMSERPQLVQEYESGKAIPNGQVLARMSRALGVRLSLQKE